MEAEKRFRGMDLLFGFSFSLDLLTINGVVFIHFLDFQIYNVYHTFKFPFFWWEEGGGAKLIF